MSIGITETYTLSLHDALPISSMLLSTIGEQVSPQEMETYTGVGLGAFWLPKDKLLFFSSISNPPDLGITRALHLLGFSLDRKSTRLNSSHPSISYAVFCLKKK